MTLAPLSVSGCLPAGNPANSPVSADAGAFPFTARGGHSSALALSRAGRASSRHIHSGNARFRAGRSPVSSLFETGRGFGSGLFYGSAISASRITGRQVMNRKESSQAQMGPTHITLFEQAQAFCKPWAREDCAMARAARVSA